MNQKRPLEAMEEMVQKLPAINKKRKRKIQRFSLQYLGGARAGSRQPIRRSHHTDTQTTHPQPMPFTTDDKTLQFECLSLPRMQSNTV